MKEDILINIIKDQLGSSASYIGDDTAFVKEKDIILTQDTLVEDVHFRLSTISPYDLGLKSIAVNLSDIAASGGIAKYMLISLSMPQSIDQEFVSDFYKGVAAICSDYNVKVVGGDITGADKLSITVSAIGESDNVSVSKRSNAKEGDLVVVSAEHGNSRAGLWILENKELAIDIPEDIKDRFIKSHIKPTPQLELGRQIAIASSPRVTIMDTSDGLADALFKISKMSNVSMEIDLDAVPVDKDLKLISRLANVNELKWIFFGGEDYQLVSCISEEAFNQLKRHASLKVIGKVIKAKEEPTVFVKNNSTEFAINQKSLDCNSFDHFGQR